MLSNASYAFKVAQETIRSTLLQNEKKSRERLLFGVKKSGTIFFSKLVSFVFFSFCARSGFSVYFSLTTFDGSSVRSCFAR